MSGLLRNLGRELAGAAPPRAYSAQTIPFAPRPEAPADPAGHMSAPWGRSESIPGEAPAQRADTPDQPPSPRAPKMQFDRLPRESRSPPDDAPENSPAVATNVGRPPKGEPPRAQGNERTLRTDPPDPPSDRAVLPAPTALSGNSPPPRRETLFERAMLIGPEPFAAHTPPVAAAQPPPRPAHSPPAAMRKTETSEPADIHVHIGRIEVMQESPRPQSPPRKPRKTPRAPDMTLDAYLAKRGGRS